MTKIGMEGRSPLIRYDWLTDSAAFRPAAAIGGLMATLFGQHITLREGIVAASNIPLPTELDGVSVEVGGHLAPLHAVANVNGVEQINFQLPWDLAAVPGGEYVDVVVDNNGSRSLPLLRPILEIGPERRITARFFLQGNSDVLAVHLSDGTLVTQDNPARREEVIILFATGLGPVDPPVQDGYASPADPPSRVITMPRIAFGGIQGDVLFSGLTPGLVGLYQVNAKVPSDAPTGKVTVQLLYDQIGPAAGAIEIR
ncbi:MAG: hypothetical protein JST93_22085 [Acidobacteria bacterium]|nr:hypothetical protein [Acidobacteriota bacterium]